MMQKVQEITGISMLQDQLDLSLPQDCSGKLASIMPTTPTLLEIEDIQQSSPLS